jgi:inorganic pyrophosphatase
LFTNLIRFYIGRGNGGMIGAIDWEHWEAIIRHRGITVDRPKGSAHPRYPDRIYPVDYGYLPGTVGGDGHEVDVFAGSARTGLVGALVTHDALKADDEIKLLWNVTDEDIGVIEHFVFGGGMTGYFVRRPVTGAD